MEKGVDGATGSAAVGAMMYRTSSWAMYVLLLGGGQRPGATEAKRQLWQSRLPGGAPGHGTTASKRALLTSP